MFSLKRNSTIYKFSTFIAVMLFGFLTPSPQAFAFVSNQERPTIKPFKELTIAKRKKRKKRKKKKRRSKKSKSKSTKHYSSAFTVNVGYESSYGNGIGFNLRPMQMLEFTTGVGYTLSGIRVGAGSDLLFKLGSSFELQTGVAVGYGTGTESSVTIEGEFTDDSTGQASPIRASRQYQLTPYTYTSVRVGGRFPLSKSTYLYGVGNYNVVLSGNEVEFFGDIEYEKAVEVTNKAQAEETFEEKGKEEVTAGGIGFTSGIIIEL